MKTPTKILATLLLLGTDGCVAWIATAPVALVEGDNLVIDITTADGKLYRCTKQIPAAGVTFAAGSIMTTNITLGGNAPLVESDTPANPDLPATIEIVIDPKVDGVIPEGFPKEATSYPQPKEFEFEGYPFVFNSSVPFYNYKSKTLNTIRFIGITSTQTASILLPRIDGYVLDKVILSSIDENKTRGYRFAVLEDLSEEITTDKYEILTSKQTEFDVSLSSADANCYIYIYHNNSSSNKYADLTYLSLTYTKIE